MTLVDFTHADWQLTDTGGNYSRTPTRATVTAMRRDAELFSHLDLGIGHFGDFTHTFEMNMPDADPGLGGTTSLYFPWVLTNTPGAWEDLIVSDDSLAVLMYPGAAKIIKISDQTNDNSDTYSPISLDTSYFCKAKRTGAILELFVYNNAAMTTLLPGMPLSLGCTTDAMRYLMNAASQHRHDGNIEHNVTAWMQNLDLNEAQLVPAPMIGSARSRSRAGILGSRPSRIRQACPIRR